MEFTLRSEADKKAVNDYIQKLDLSKRQYKVSISKKEEKRTLPQNRLYRLWLNCISFESGNDVDDLHEYFKMRFLGVHSRIIYGEEISRTVSTTELNTEQFTAYLDKVQKWSSIELGIMLPNPEDLIFEQFAERYRNYI